jgi:hypothetical protein
LIDAILTEIEHFEGLDRVGQRTARSRSKNTPQNASTVLKRLPRQRGNDRDR